MSSTPSSHAPRMTRGLIDALLEGRESAPQEDRVCCRLWVAVPCGWLFRGADEELDLPGVEDDRAGSEPGD